MAARTTREGRQSPPMVIKLADWPETDRRLWEAGEWLNARPRKTAFGSRLKPVSIRGAMKSYGRFLAVLRDHADLLPGETPAERVTPERVSRFVATLREEGNQGNTIKSRLMFLRMAIRITEPVVALSWLTRPGGYSLDSLLPQEPRDLTIIPSPVLYRWGLDLMDEALAGQAAAGGGEASAGRAAEGKGMGGKWCSEETLRLRRDRRFRDGLIIAILACRAPRLRSLASIRIGRQFQQIGEEFWLCFGKTDIKNRKPIEYSLPEGLTPYIQRYLGEVRSRLLGPARTDWLWVIEQGAPLQDIGIAQMIARRSLARFGQAFGPHRFRHSLATTLAEEDPDNPGLAAALLGITEGVVAEHYRKAKQVRAALLLQKQLAAERDRTRLLAEREMARGVVK
jgi:hypothetical protein